MMITEKVSGHRILCGCLDFKCGGFSSFTLNFGRAWRMRGYMVGAIVMEPFGELHREFQESLDSVEIVRRGLETRAAYLRRLIQRIVAWQPNVIIINAVPMVQAVLPYLPKEIRRFSVLHNVLDVEVGTALANGPWLDWVVAVSDGAREQLEQANADGVKLATIPVGLEIPRNERKQDKAENPLRLIYVGRIWPQKNLPGLLRVLSQLHDASVPFTMTIVGDGPGLSALRRQVQSSSFAGQTRVLGAQRPDQVGRLLDANDFLLLTSHFEGTPHAVLEAMAHGLVAVASRLPGSTDRIITHGVDGYLCERERPGEYVNALQRFLDRPQDFGSLSRAARLTASSRYSTEALAARYEQLFGDLRRASLVAPKQIRDGITVPQALRPDFPGVFLQAKHRIADLWRFMAFGTRRVRWTSRQLNP